jgi:(1->4)-alpha-D-glucan 1-alpha-D-glucosylmutase
VSGAAARERPGAWAARRRDRAPREDVPLPLAAIPRATYRVQLHRDFTFADVTALVPYLAALGISHVYCSPYLRARPGSRHGYDIVDHAMLNPELGSRDDFDRMVDALANAGMSHICDVVPNHMTVMGGDNAWWMDVLKHGPSSRYAGYFDIDWRRQDPDLAGKVLVPVLGDAYGSVLERGELAVAFEAASGSFSVRYFEHRLPLDPASCADILLRASAAARAATPPVNASHLEAIAFTLKALPRYDDVAPSRVTARRRKAAELEARLAALVRTDAALRDAIDVAVDGINGQPGDSASFDALHALLEAQPFRLAHWRVASDEINYRRFFDINELAALRMEDPGVFEATHELILTLAARGVVGGLRIDHPDGLFDPARYFASLQRGYRDRLPTTGDDAQATRAGIYVVIEKIAAGHERVPAAWPVHGTTGYRFASVVNGLFVDARAKARIDRTWRGFVLDEAQDFAQASHSGRLAIMDGPLASELRVLTLRASRLAHADRKTRDFTFTALRDAIREIVARFPVYRTYVDAQGASAQDRRYIDWAVAQARARSRVSDASIFDFLHRALLAAPGDAASASTLQAYRDFAMRVQQFTAPVTAKGVEDTALYRFNRFVALNEVGADPEQFGFGVRAFHAASADRAATWPHTMLATSTHDNKRSEDVRARLDVISEMPGAWRTLVRRWARMNRSRKRLVDDRPAPSRNDEYLLYQTLAGTFAHDAERASGLDAYRTRIAGYMRKAAREAKVHTSWLSPHPAYEEALQGFVDALLDANAESPFLAELRSECATFAWFGQLNSVSMTLLKLASPGVPDIYQGNELLDLSLVDPDNRRAVDYGARARHLASLGALEHAPAQVRALFDAPLDGRAKRWVIVRALALRRQRTALFAFGDYRPLEVAGVRADHVVAFARVHERDTLVAVAGRLFHTLGPRAGALPPGDAWADTTVDLSHAAPGGAMTNILTGETWQFDERPIRVARLFADFPGALLHFTTR